MIPMTLAAIAAATGGRLADATGDELVTGPATVDSRAVTPGGLFVAVPGEQVDGHDFAARALAAGAAGVLAARTTGAPSVLIEPGGDAAYAVVEALGRLARTALTTATEVNVTAVTGSSGKTSTKDLIAQLLTAAGPTVATQGSYNNDLGLPLTVLGIDAGTRQLVLEMGSRAIGDIARLCRIARTDTGVVLNVGLAHVGEFGSIERTALAKGELVESLTATGVAVLNADDQLVLAMANRTPARVVTFGIENAADVRAERVSLDGHGRARFRISTPTGSADVGLQLVGVHHVSNSLAAAAAAMSAGLDLDAVAAGLSAAQPRSAGRMQVCERSDGVTVVNDAYNANPDSVRAALHALVALGRARRTWAVLGEMLELGPAAESEHAAIGRLTMSLGIARLVVVGAGARSMQVAASATATEHDTGQERSVYVPGVDAALELLREELRAGDVVLVKSSHSAGLGALGDALVAEETADKKMLDTA